MTAFWLGLKTSARVIHKRLFAEQVAQLVQGHAALELVRGVAVAEHVHGHALGDAGGGVGRRGRLLQKLDAVLDRLDRKSVV